MTDPSPLSAPGVWNRVAGGYADELLPSFELYAKDAIERGGLTAESIVLDVATGPGTVALLAAPTVTRVVGIDFSESMLEIARRRAEQEGAGNVEFRQGDGQALPVDDGSFDAAFSMFGLMFFPDRAAGFSELYRALRPGGRAVVASWAPTAESPLLMALFGAMQEALPELPFGNGEGPLSSAAAFSAEMEQAGFTNVLVESVIHVQEIPSVRRFWEIQMRSSAPVALLRETLPEEEWEEFAGKVSRKLEKEYGTDPLEVGWTAFLGHGRR